MKKLKIKNPRWRFLAGAGIFLPSLAVALFCLYHLCVGIGHLVYPVYAGHDLSIVTRPARECLGVGLYTLGLFILTGFFGFWILKGCKQTGNKLFNNTA